MMKRLAALLLALLLAAPTTAATVVSSATSLTLSAGVDYVKTTSSTGTWTMPAVSGNKDRIVTIENRGSTSLTVQRAGSNNLYTTTTVTSVTIAAGSWATFHCDGTYWIVRTGGNAGALTSADIDTSAELAAILGDETGSGAAVFGTSPTISNPTTSGLVNNGASVFSSGVSLNSSNPAITITQTWNNAGATFTGFVENITNTNSAAASLLMDLQVGGVSQFSVSKAGVLTGTLTNCTGLPISTGISGLGTGVATWAATPSSANLASAITDETGSGALAFATSPTFTTNLSINGGSGAAVLSTDAANTLAVRNSTNAQIFRVYNTYTNSSNGKWTEIAAFNTTDIDIQTNGNGTGAAATNLCFGTVGTRRWKIDTSGNLSGDTTSGGDLTVGPHGGNAQIIINRTIGSTYGRLMFQDSLVDVWSMGMRGDAAVTDTLSLMGPASASSPYIWQIIPGSSTQCFRMDLGSSSPALHTVICGGNSKSLTESSATAFVQVAVASGSYTGGIIHYTIHADDGTDFQARTGDVHFSMVNKAGTETCNLGTVLNESIAVSTGTLTVSFDSDTSPTNAVNIRANAVSSLTQTTLKLEYRVEIFGPATTVTPQ
jgi:hypothetical protein